MEYNLVFVGLEKNPFFLSKKLAKWIKGYVVKSLPTMPAK